MTKNQNKIIFFIVGIFIGGISIILFYNVKEMLDNLFQPPYVNSSEKLYAKLAKIGIELPEKAYNIEFYFDDGFLDYTCYLAFSASPEELKDFIGDAPKIWNDKTKPKPTPKVSKNKDGEKIIPWWPENTTKFDIYYGHFLWIGYDKEHYRVYLYQYSM